jgi:predicted SAM-dependent methyltransferase
MITGYCAGLRKVIATTPQRKAEERSMKFWRKSAPAYPPMINIGCGYDKRPGFLNVDSDPACEPDILLAGNDFSHLPKRAFEHALAHDVLEHIERTETANALLEWVDLLKIGGTMALQTSSVLGVAKLMERHQNYCDHANFTIYLFGNQQHPGDYHHTGFTEQTLRVHLISAGLEVIDLALIDHWLFAVETRKVSDWSALADAGMDNADFIAAACREALFREPEEVFANLWLGWLDAGAHDQRGILKMLYASEERRLRIAERHGL